MKVPKNFALRSTRKGIGVLPPNPMRWEHEHNALDLRHELSLSLEERLLHEDAFALLNSVLAVVAHTELRVEPRHRDHFAGANSKKWSGMCIPFPEGDHLVVYNGVHALTRIRATLMEEFFHLWLGHAPSRVRLLTTGDGGRDFDRAKESEAYGSGAAALVPYKTLRAMLEEGVLKRDIAEHFFVSEQLVDFRIRVSKLSKLSLRQRA